MSTATISNVPGHRLEQSPFATSAPRFFPDELRNQPARPNWNQPPPEWSRTVPADPKNALIEIAAKVFSDKDRKEIQRLENEIGKADEQRKLHCDSKKIDQALWDLSHDLTLSPEEFADRSRALEQERQAIPQWTLALDRRDAELKEKLRHYAIKLARELPGRVAQEINKQEKASGPDGWMAFWGVNQNNDPSTLYPLRRLHALAGSWLKHLQANSCEAQSSRIRAILADSGALKPKVFVFRSQF